MSVAKLPTRSASIGGVVTPQALLVAAGVAVALSILAGSPLARLLNGVGGALWVAAAVWMVLSLRGERRPLPVLGVALAVAGLMAVVVRPGTYPEAILGFLAAGAAVAFAARGGAHWALLAPALYFPFHITVAIGRVVASGGARSVRTDPPPTESFVPLSMIVAAAVGGLLVARWHASRDSRARR